MPEAIAQPPLINSDAVVSPADPAGSLLRMRRGLRYSLREVGGESHYLVEDPASGRFFRVGVPEWNFACRLDGRMSLAQAVECMRRDHLADDLTLQQVNSLCQWLIKTHLVHACSADGARPTAQTPAQPASWAAAVNPFFIKIPLLRPERLLNWLYPYGRWSIHRLSVAAWLVLCLWGFVAVVTDWQRFAHSATAYFSPHTWLWLIGVWIALKVVHETFHGLVCKKFGGFVSEAGIVLILFSPVAYVDVTSTWRFRGKWPRILTSAAGMYIEFGIAALAAIIWRFVDFGATSQLCHSVVTTASVTTLLFNANPLMRFDGYYILADLCDIQNLYSEGRLYVRALFRKLFLGLETPIQTPSGWKGVLVRCYGVAATVWRVVVCASLIIAAGTLFHGAGLTIALFGVVSWVAMPLLQFVRRMMRHDPQNKPNRVRFLKVSLAVVTLCGVLALAPRPGGVVVPAVVAYSPLNVVRADTRGFVEQVHVGPGEQVTEGQLLVTLRGDDVRAELRDVELQLEQAAAVARDLHNNDDLPAYQAELERLSALEGRRDQLAAQVAGLQVRAPANGRVLDFHLQQLLGQYIDVGTPLLRVAAETDKEIQISIPEKYLESLTHKIGVSPRVTFVGHSSAVHSGPLAKVEPRASVVLRHEVMGAHNGGPLPVEAVPEDSQLYDDSSRQVRLTTPRFHGVIQLPPETAVQLRDGQLGKARFRDIRETMGRWLRRSVTDWVRNKVAVNTMTR